MFPIRGEVHATCSGTIHETRAAHALTHVTELLVLTLRAAHAAVVRIGTRIDASREATAIGAAIAHALTCNTRRAKRTRIHARAAESRIRHRIDADLLAILPRAYGLALGALALTRNARFTGIAICLAIATMRGIRGQICARIVASDLTLRTNASARNAGRVGWTIIAAHAAILRILREIHASDVALLTEHGPLRACALPGHAHTVGATIDATLAAILRIVRQIRARIRVVASHGVCGTHAALSGHTGLSCQTGFFTHAAVVRILRKIRTPGLAGHLSGRAYAIAIDT